MLATETKTEETTVTMHLPMAEQAAMMRERADDYHRYHVESKETEDRWKFPRRFNVKVGKFGLAKLIAKEFFQFFGKWDAILARPCTYGVFSGPVGGFSPRPDLCVGCLRCTVQHPDFVTVTHNAELHAMGDEYLSPLAIHTIDLEAAKGNVPVRGQGYRGKFGGPGYDQMFTDMSEIVRPSRDGIHGRELIGTSVDIGSKPMHLKFGADGAVLNAPKMFTIQMPFTFDAPPTAVESTKGAIVPKIYAAAAAQLDTLAFLRAGTVRAHKLAGASVVPIIQASEAGSASAFGAGTRMVEVEGWDAEAFQTVENSGLLCSVRLPLVGDWKAEMMSAISGGAAVIHLVADHHGMADDGRFVMDLFQEAHFSLVEAGMRDEVTLIGAGGIAGADHLPKTIICGMDAVALDYPLLVAMQARLTGDLRSRDAANVALPPTLDIAWGQQRVVNLSCAWRDQLLEILGAMGVREVRRLRGEIGRAMWCGHLEDEAFADIEGYIPNGTGGGH